MRGDCERDVHRYRGGADNLYNNMNSSEKGKESKGHSSPYAKVEYGSPEDKTISEELLKQKYLDDLNRFVIGEYSFMEEKMIHNFSNSQECNYALIVV